MEYFYEKDPECSYDPDDMTAEYNPDDFESDYWEVEDPEIEYFDKDELG